MQVGFELDKLTSNSLEEFVGWFGGQTEAPNVTTGDFRHGGDELVYGETCSGQTRRVEVFFCNFIEDGGAEDKLPSEGTVEFGMVGAIVRPRDIFYIPAGILMRKCETVAGVCSLCLGTFSFNEGGN